ncbi:MAG: asparagine synthase (glutamine-hydrolyzing) [Ignavibacteriales bacterium]|nr:asparagine synthase (glutamine-hydrolyzing) [Ignavibacteriales bacterium]
MCGIFGVLSFNAHTINFEKVTTACKRLAHRGPDGEGMYVSPFGNLVIVHRRLSIIDLTDLGRQPMSTADGRFTITFNGEIYNYRELQSFLEQKQIKLTSQSDTEVILLLYVMEGEECLKRLRGMFAFAIWDEKKQALFAARDRFGIKPFYFLCDDMKFMFSSEIKAIRTYEPKLSLSSRAMDAFLKSGSVPAPLTIYENVFALPPGCCIHASEKDGTEIKEWWRHEELYAAPKRFTRDAREEVHQALLSSIRAHCVSDVEVGAFLSGGIDSTAIISLMRQAGYDRIKTVSITFPGHELDESRYSKLATDLYRTEHYEYKLTEEEVCEHFDRIMRVMDQPTIDGINTYFVSKAAKDLGLKVVMSGLGGDELFGGYPSFRLSPWLSRYQRVAQNFLYINQAVKASLNVFNGQVPQKLFDFLDNTPSAGASYTVFRGIFSESNLRSLGWKDSYPHPYEVSKIEQFSNVDVANSINGHPVFRVVPPGRNGCTRPSPLQKVSTDETGYYMANQLLNDTDVFSMAHSLELRVPFVDHILYKTAYQYLDDSYSSRTTKRMLVECTGNLPYAITHRKKMGFTFPFADWFGKGKLKAKAEELILNERMAECFSAEALESFHKEFLNGQVHWSRVWTLAVLGRFLTD